MARLISVNVGLPREVEWNGGTVRTAIWKSPVKGRVMARVLNLDGDGQADLAGHGGEQRSVLVYQLDAYRHWHERLCLAVDAYGQFGENLTVDGLADDEVCIGDRYRIGDAVFEVSQPRVTCYRVGLRLQQSRLPALLVGEGRPGFYMRVIQEGHVEAGDEIVKVGAGTEGMTVAEIDALLYKGAHPVDQVERALRIPALSPGWKTSFEALLRAARAGLHNGNAGLRPAVEKPLAWQGFEALRVVAVRDESEDVRSFVLASSNGEPLPVFSAGQHIAVRMKMGAASVTRMYSLSGDARSGSYRIGVKREAGGVASNHLHQHVNVGDVIETSAPRGTFTLQERGRPVVLLSGGIGVTPLLAMLHQLASAGSSRKVWWLHGARDGRHHPFRVETAALVGALPAGRSHVVYSRPDPEDLADKAFDEVGHLDVDVLTRLGVSPQSDFYLCGPSTFLASLEAQLRNVWGVDAARVYSEVFGVAVAATGSQHPHSPAELGAVWFEHGKLRVGQTAW